MARLPPGPPRRKWPFGLERLRVMAERNPFLVVGLPMLLFVAAGSLALQQFNEVKFRVRDRQTLVTSETAANIKKNQRPFHLQEEYFRLQSLLEDEQNSYTNKPVPGKPAE